MYSQSPRLHSVVARGVYHSQVLDKVLHGSTEPAVRFFAIGKDSISALRGRLQTSEDGDTRRLAKSAM
jgi:hypothetical protein